MPETVLNSKYKIEEDSYEYLLRHTMYRPRHLQLHLELLSKSYKDMVIQPSMLPKAVAESSKNITKFFVDEYRADHPNLGKFIKSLARRDNIMEYKEFRKLVGDALLRYSDKPDHGKISDRDVEEKIDTLYAMGFFGIIRFVEDDTTGDMYCPPTKEAKRHHVDFFYKNPQTIVSDALADDSLIALHPIIIDAAGLRPHPTLIVG